MVYLNGVCISSFCYSGLFPDKGFFGDLYYKVNECEIASISVSPVVFEIGSSHQQSITFVEKVEQVVYSQSDLSIIRLFTL